ncbi:hypothetical protein CSKR_112223 [Clonorchis sinensis]|uniref:Uncharacterized protein n=1 Tax=Clonorchis sinensis TaxID=79923 RepID=A0A419QEV5_CLOSI|nr:hypothetical protein CSKR_112223 [Clonorchis sinensis]
MPHELGHYAKGVSHVHAQLTVAMGIACSQAQREHRRPGCRTETERSSDYDKLTVTPLFTHPDTVSEARILQVPARSTQGWTRLRMQPNRVLTRNKPPNASIVTVRTTNVTGELRQRRQSDHATLVSALLDQTVTLSEQLWLQPLAHPPGPENVGSSDGVDGLWFVRRVRQFDCERLINNQGNVFSALLSSVLTHVSLVNAQPLTRRYAPLRPDDFNSNVC